MINKELLSQLLETPCEFCKGKGGDAERGRWSYCPICEGGGYTPTEFGEFILNFIGHHFRSLLVKVKEDD